MECVRWSSPEQNSPFALGNYLIPMISWRRLANPTELCYYFVRCPSSHHCAEKLPVTGGNLAQSIKGLMLFPDSPALFLFWRASAALRFIHVSQNEKLASHLSAFLSGNSM